MVGDVAKKVFTVCHMVLTMSNVIAISQKKHQKLSMKMAILINNFPFPQRSKYQQVHKKTVSFSMKKCTLTAEEPNLTWPVGAESCLPGVSSKI